MDPRRRPAAAAFATRGSNDEPELLLGLEASSMEVLAQYNAALGKQRAEQEREAVFEALGDLRVAPEEAHWLDATIATLREELWRVQEGKALLDQEVQAQVARSLAVKGELQRLEEQALEDRVRIQRLLALPQPLRGGDVTITLPADAARPFPLAAAAEGAGAGAGEWQGQQGEEEQGGSVMQAGAAVSVEGRARRRAEWVAQALRWERDPGVARLLREIQGAMQDIARARAAYEPEVLELQRARNLREAEAERALGPILSEIAGLVARMGEQEQEAAATVRDHLQLLVEGQSHTAQTLAEHASLAQAREEAQARTRAFKARLAKAAKAVAAAAAGTAGGKQEEEEGAVEALRAELAAVQGDMADIKQDYDDRRPRMEATLAKLAAAHERAAAALGREKRRYRMDSEGYENDLRTLAREVLRAQRVEVKLRAERRRLRREEREAARGQRAEGEGEEGEEEEGEEESESEEEEEEDEALGELEDLMLELRLLSKNRAPAVATVGSGEFEE